MKMYSHKVIHEYIRNIRKKNSSRSNSNDNDHHLKENLNEVCPQQHIVTTKKYEILTDVKIQKNSKASYMEETRENDHALQKFISVK